LLGLVEVAFVLAAAAGSSPSVDVRGETQCPTRAQFAEALEGLIPARAGAAPPDVAELRGAGRAGTVRLSSAAGELIGEKALPETGACPERARAAAVIVAAWEARLRAGAAGGLETPRPVAAPPPPPPPIVHEDVARRAAEPPPADPLAIAPGAALLASLVAGQLAVGGLAEVELGRADGRFAVGLGGLVVDTHDTAVGAGKGAWRRLGGVVDLRARLRTGRAELGLRAGVALTALTLEGRAVPNAQSTTIFDAGALAALRAKVRLGAFAPWLEAAAAFWPGRHSLFVQNAPPPAEGEVPTVEALFSLGASFEAVP
jgi:hypothetical protein